MSRPESQGWETPALAKRDILLLFERFRWQSFQGRALAAQPLPPRRKKPEVFRFHAVPLCAAELSHCLKHRKWYLDSSCDRQSAAVKWELFRETDLPSNPISYIKRHKHPNAIFWLQLYQRSISILQNFGRPFHLFFWYSSSRSQGWLLWLLVGGYESGEETWEMSKEKKSNRKLTSTVD